MKTVRNKKELEAAIIARETEVLVEGFRFKLACQAAAKFQKSRLAHYFNPKYKKYKPYQAVRTAVTPIYFAVIVAIMGITIIAMLMKYNVEIDISKGILKLTYNNR